MEQEIAFAFDEKKHVYTLDGRRLYGITNVLSVIAKPSLIQWAADEAVKYLGWLNPKYENAEKCLDGAREALETIKTLSHEEWHKRLCEARVQHCKKKKAAGTVGTDVHALCEEYVKRAISENNGLAYPLANEWGKDGENPMFQKFVNWAVENKVQFLASEKKMYSREMWCAGTCDFTAKIKDKLYMGDVKTSGGIYGREYFFQCAGYVLMAEEHGEKFDASIIVRLGKDGSFEVRESFDLESDKNGFRAALALFKAMEY